MSKQHIVVVGGGLAGLSTGCYALENGWDVTIVEHNEALGGVCTAAWPDSPTYAHSRVGCAAGRPRV